METSPTHSAEWGPSFIETKQVQELEDGSMWEGQKKKRLKNKSTLSTYTSLDSCWVKRIFPSDLKPCPTQSFLLTVQWGESTLWAFLQRLHDITPSENTSTTLRVREGWDDMLDRQRKQENRSKRALALWSQLRHQLMSSLGMCPSRHTFHRSATGGHGRATDGWGTWIIEVPVLNV